MHLRLPRKILLVTGTAALLLAGGGAAAAGTHGAVSARTVASGGTWGTAKEVPGSAQLNQGGFADITSVSCASAGNCSAVGSYAAAHRQQAMVVNEMNGTWRTAKEVPGIGTLNHGSAQLNSVSCASAGNCSAGGVYVDGSHNRQVFVVNETNGVWGHALEVPGIAALNQGGNASIESVSCGAAGNCSAGGFYTDVSGNEQVFVVNETRGTWGNAKEVPGSGALNQGGQAGADLYSVSCRSVGNCTAGGFYADASDNTQPFVVSEMNGTWGTAKQLPGITALDQGGYGDLEVLSCGSAGNCSAGGIYTDPAGTGGLYVDNQTNGTWGTPEEIPGFATFSQGGYEYFTMACASAGNCAAGGLYNSGQAFVVNETNSTWGHALEVPGTAALNSGEYASVYSVSCASAGNCSAGGSYTDSFGHMQAFVVNETNGTWRGAIEVPGTVVLNQGGSASIESVSCASAGHCSAGGFYTDSSKLSQVFVVNET